MYIIWALFHLVSEQALDWYSSPSCFLLITLNQKEKMQKTVNPSWKM